jgi:hypothetical protein
LRELFARHPPRQGGGVEAARQLHVAIDRLPRSHIPEANQRRFQFVAQIAQRFEDDMLFAPGRHEHVMDLVQNQDLDAEVAQKTDCGPLELNDWSNWRGGQTNAGCSRKSSRLSARRRTHAPRPMRLTSGRESSSGSPKP